MIKLRGLFKLLISCHLVLLQISYSLCKIEPRVVNGRATSISDAKYLMQIFVDNDFWCGGTLVGSRYVVTAAHCVYDVEAFSIIVKGGASLLSEPGIRSRVDRIMIPRSFSSTTLHMDVAVLKLTRPLEGPLVEPVALCTEGWQHNDPVQIFGWGKKGETAQTNPNRVESVQIKVVGRIRCRKMYGYLTNSMFCAALPGKSSCYGDSGGPVMVKGKFCGVISWAEGCARPGYPDVYTNILFREASNFIRDAMRK